MDIDLIKQKAKMIDPTTNIGKLRLRVADYSDYPMLPDSVYSSVLADTDNNLSRSAATISIYLLGMLSQKVDRQMGLQLIVKGSQAFKAYKDFLLLTVSNPNFMDISPIPVNLTGTTLHPLIQFQRDWNLNYTNITQSEQMNWDAIGSPSNGDPFNYSSDYFLSGQY